MHQDIIHLIKRIGGVFFMLFGFVNITSAQNASTQGTDFWFAFMNNNESSPTQTCLILSAERACNVTVSNPNTGWTTSVSIPAGGRVDVDIPLLQGYYSAYTDGYVYDIGCHVVATDTISAYSMNFKDASFDGGHLLPTSTLADEYMIETIPPGLNGSSILIVGTDNNTSVDITPSVATANGWAANTLHTITLNAGQAYQITTSASSGASSTFSGTRVKTQDCKKIAVFAGGKCAQAPAGCTYCDHIYDPMIPIIYWGNHFIVTSSQTRTMDIVRITALNAGTTVAIDGVNVATLGAGGTFDYQLTSTQGSNYIETSGPAVCYLYLTGQSCGGGSGDPSMVYITPIEQNIKKITFGTYQRSSTNHYVNVVTATSNVSSVLLDGNNIGGQFSIVPGNPAYSFARVSISHATHTLECDSGLVAHVYGLYNVTSYAYSVGSSARNLTNTMFINDVNLMDIPEDQLYCPNSPIDFELELNYNYNSISWNFGDSTTGTGNPCTHSFPNAGSYLVTAIVERTMSSNCYGTQYDTIRAIVNLPPPDPIPLYVSICEGNTYDFYGRELATTGIYIDTLEAEGDCDSIIELHLSVVPAAPITTNMFICSGSTYFFNGVELDQPGTYYDTVSTSANCDSIIELHLSYSPLDPVEVYAEICPGDSYTLFEQEYDQPGIYTDTTTTSGGCDSIIELHLAYADVPTVSLGDDRVLCSDDEHPVHLSPTTTHAEGATYEWNTGDSTSAINVDLDGLYSVTVTNQSGCIGSDDINITTLTELTLELEEVGDLCENGYTLLIATTNAPNIHWNTGESTPEIEVHAYGTYNIRVFDGPCQITQDINVEYCPPDLYFPNIITPNGDGKNDVFAIENLNPDIPNVLTIYNRWGKKVFEMENYQTYMRNDVLFNTESGFTGSDISDGVYYYVFHYDDPLTPIDYHSSLTIIH